MTLLRIVSVGEGKPARRRPPRPKRRRLEAAAHEAERVEPAKGADVVKETKSKKAEPVKKAATAKAADEKPAAEKKPAAKKAPAKKPAAKK
jgi:hypothetical protein